MLVVVLLVLGTALAALLYFAGAARLASAPARMRVGMAVALAFTGIDHLVTPERYLPMMPGMIPAPEQVILLTGLLELAGVAALFVTSLRRPAAVLLALYFVGVLPANVHVLLQGASVAGLPDAPAYYAFRLLLQPVFIWWALAAGEVVPLPRWVVRSTGSRDARPRNSGLARPAGMALVILGALVSLSVGARSAFGARAERDAVQGNYRLTVTIEDARNARGLLRVAVFAVADGFPRNQDAALRREERPVLTGQDTVTFDDLAPGRYAVAVHHDENGNRALDANAFGVPREGWGASMDPRPRLRAPRFDEAVFDLRENRHLAIRLTY